MKLFLLLNFITPAVMLLVAEGLRRHKPCYPGPYGAGKWKAGASGYNTPLSRKSQAHWDAGQKAAAEEFCANGKMALVAALVCSMLGLTFWPWWVGLAVGCTLGLGSMVEAFVQTELKIKDQISS